MGASAHLDVYFKTSNPLPLQELTGIFSNEYPDLAVVREVPKSPNQYTVVIHEHRLNEPMDAIHRIINHCKKNQRVISISITLW